MPAVVLLLLPILVFVGTLSMSRLLLGLLTTWAEQRVKTMSIVIAIGPALIVVLGSLGQLQFQDVVLAALLICGFAWYIKRVQFLNQ